MIRGMQWLEEQKQEVHHEVRSPRNVRQVATMKSHQHSPHKQTLNLTTSEHASVKERKLCGLNPRKEVWATACGEQEKRTSQKRIANWLSNTKSLALRQRQHYLDRAGYIQNLHIYIHASIYTYIYICNNNSRKSHDWRKSKVHEVLTRRKERGKLM